MAVNQPVQKSRDEPNNDLRIDIIMAEKRVQRRLTAILAADVVGYSRLMGRDEEGTLARMKALRSEVIDPGLAEHGGRIVKTMGDGLLVEFASAVDAVRHAVEVSKAVEERNADLPGDQQILFRVGVNIGDVIVEQGDIFGDGVNIAARLEGQAEPGGICVSEEVQKQIDGKVNVVFEDMGIQPLKNIDRPVRVFAVTELQSGEGAVAGGREPYRELTLPDKPSIAVLPFQNMSGDPEQEYFADGMTEDLITALSMIRWFFVTARNTTFAYKGTSPNISHVARDLGVRYVLEGSVRKAGNRVRINAQLIDGASGNHVWAKRYDRELEDIFAVQDELTETIVGALEPELGKAERERAHFKRPENLPAWDLFQQGLWHSYRRTEDDLVAAQTLFERARALDPHLAGAFAGAAEAFFFQLVDGYLEDPKRGLDIALELGRRGVEIDDQDALARYAYGRVLIIARQHEAAIPELGAAIELNPSYAQAHFALAMALGTSGQAETAIPHFGTAMRLSPHDPYLGQFMVHMGAAHLFMHRHDTAAEWARKSLRQPNIRWSRWVLLISALGHLGQLEDARQAVRSLHRFRDEVDIAFVKANWPISDATSRAHLVEGLQRAGL